MIVACSDCDIHDPPCHVRSISAALDSADTSRLMVTQIVTKRVIVRMMMLLWWFVAPHQDSTCETLNFPCEYKMVQGSSLVCGPHDALYANKWQYKEESPCKLPNQASHLWLHAPEPIWTHYAEERARRSLRACTKGIGASCMLKHEGRKSSTVFYRFWHIQLSLSYIFSLGCLQRLYGIVWKPGRLDWWQTCSHLPHAHSREAKWRALNRLHWIWNHAKFHVNNMNYYCTALFCRRAKNGCTDRIFQSGNSGVEIESLSHTCRIYMRKSKIENPLFRQRSWTVQLLGQQWKWELPATQSTHLSLTVV